MNTPDLPASDTRSCPYCKEEIKADAVKCKHCGSRITPERPSHGGTCPYCKEEIHPEAIRCKHCRSDLLKAGTEDCGCGAAPERGFTPEIRSISGGGVTQEWGGEGAPFRTFLRPRNSSVGGVDPSTGHGVMARTTWGCGPAGHRRVAIPFTDIACEWTDRECCKFVERCYWTREGTICIWERGNCFEAPVVDDFKCSHASGAPL